MEEVDEVADAETQHMPQETYHTPHKIEIMPVLLPDHTCANMQPRSTREEGEGVQQRLEACDCSASVTLPAPLLPYLHQRQLCHPQRLQQ